MRWLNTSNASYALSIAMLVYWVESATRLVPLVRRGMCGGAESLICCKQARR